MNCDQHKCSACPLRGRTIGCVAHASGHGRYCQLIDPEHPDYKPAFIDVVVRKSEEGQYPVDVDNRRIPTSAPELPRHLGPLATDRELVVARYTEDVSWLNDVAMPIWLYDKGPVPATNLASHIRHIRLPNHGREAGTYLTHIISRYEHLPPLTIFCQGNPFDHSPDFLQRLWHPYTEPTSLTTQYLPNCPEQWIKDRDRVEEVFGHEVRYGDGAINAHGDQSSGRAWFNPAAWSFLFRCPRPVPQWFGYAATWVVPKDRIRKRRRDAWQWILDNLDSGASGDSWAGPLNPWAMEALWFYLFSDPKQFPLVKEAWSPRITASVAVPAAKTKPCNCGKSKPSARRKS